MDQITASRTVLADSQQEAFPYEVRAFGLRILVEKEVFSPKHFNGWGIFTRNFPDVAGKAVLEVGCGTGVTSLYAATHGADHVVALDINLAAVENTRKNIALNNVANMEVRESDIFSAVRADEHFDIIYWNTPFFWAPPDYEYASVLERGLFDPGYALTRRFLKEAPGYLLPNGAVLFGTGDFGDVREFLEIAEEYRYSVRLIVEEPSVEINPVTFQLYELRPR